MWSVGEQWSSFSRSATCLGAGMVCSVYAPPPVSAPYPLGKYGCGFFTSPRPSGFKHEIGFETGLLVRWQDDRPVHRDHSPSVIGWPLSDKMAAHPIVALLLLPLNHSLALQPLGLRLEHARQRTPRLQVNISNTKLQNKRKPSLWYQMWFSWMGRCGFDLCTSEPPRIKFQGVSSASLLLGLIGLLDISLHFHININQHQNVTEFKEHFFPWQFWTRTI